jgi:hypothetical protein
LTATKGVSKSITPVWKCIYAPRRVLGVSGFVGYLNPLPFQNTFPLSGRESSIEDRKSEGQKGANKGGVQRHHGLIIPVCRFNFPPVLRTGERGLIEQSPRDNLGREEVLRELIRCVNEEVGEIIGQDSEPVTEVCSNLSEADGDIGQGQRNFIRQRPANDTMRSVREMRV